MFKKMVKKTTTTTIGFLWMGPGSSSFYLAKVFASVFIPCACFHYYWCETIRATSFFPFIFHKQLTIFFSKKRARYLGRLFNARLSSSSV